MSSEEPLKPATRTWIARAFTTVEDVVYIGLAVLLTGIVLALLISGFVSFVQSVVTGLLPTVIVELLDQALLVLLLVELLYTVQVSFREHVLLPEPFLLVGLISVIRRVLVLTAEVSKAREKSEMMSEHVIIELAVLTVLIVSLAASLVLVKKRNTPAAAEQSSPQLR